ncbi:MAG: alpha-amylase family glycosyl hydrolase [Spirochaetes bacterium]|nr:alpha-amylase family glycosyl hydrolase [Spirochaetota bacterium]
MEHWIDDAIIYHIFPLGFCGAPVKNDFHSQPVNRLDKLYQWIEYLKDLQINTIFLGPVFESEEHGYDVADYYQVDRRLGTNEAFQHLVAVLHEKGFKVILDAVFHHTGRNFFAFQDLLQNRENSVYRDWYAGIDFHKTSPYGDPFSYESWNGYYNLCKLNLTNQAVKEHLFKAVKYWIDEFKIDGLRLDAADCLLPEFMEELKGYTKEWKKDFWLKGEVIHGDYNQWMGTGMLDSVTNYECYKGFYSSCNDTNLFEIAYSLNRQFGENGIYKNKRLYNFTDNHDVNRLTSQLKDSTHIYPIYGLLFTMPGIPALYYGSEMGLTGKKDPCHDHHLRPALELDSFVKTAPHPHLKETIKKLAKIRKENLPLKQGDYQQLLVNHQQLAFRRTFQQEETLVIINTSPKKQPLKFKINSPENTLYEDLLAGKSYTIKNQHLELEIMPNWLMILKRT